jgi:hypothetical protein
LLKLNELRDRLTKFLGSLDQVTFTNFLIEVGSKHILDEPLGGVNIFSGLGHHTSIRAIAFPR